MTRNCEIPDGVKLSIEESNFVIVDFHGCDIPPIRLTPDGAEKVGQKIQEAGNRAQAHVSFEDGDNE